MQNNWNWWNKWVSKIKNYVFFKYVFDFFLKKKKLYEQELQKLSGDVQKAKKLQAAGSSKRKKDRKTTIVDRLGTKSAIAKVGFIVV